ncbi:hypothetical protein D3C80_1853290 [compost metagenome]
MRLRQLFDQRQQDLHALAAAFINPSWQITFQVLQIIVLRAVPTYALWEMRADGTLLITVFLAQRPVGGFDG